MPQDRDEQAADEASGADVRPSPASSTTSDDGVDLTLIRWMLGLSSVERLMALQGFADSLFEMRNGRRAH